MTGLDHRPPDQKEHEDPQSAQRNAELGMKLFVVYLSVYCGFVFLNAFRPDLMDTTPFAGINLAVLYGLGLILGAFVVSLIYGWLCRTPSSTDSHRPGGAA